MIGLHAKAAGPESLWSALRDLPPQARAIEADLDLILAKANLVGRVRVNLVEAPTQNPSSAKVTCKGDVATVTASGDSSRGQAFYKALREMGFLFPHPRIQISPSWSRIASTCGKTYLWRPAVRYAGSHFHTLHPNEWVHGFLMGKRGIANETVRWLARNQQNVFDLSLLDENFEESLVNLQEPFALAKSLGVHAGVALGFTLYQQNQVRLIPMFSSPFDGMSKRALKENLESLLSKVDVSFVDIESGTSEFTSTNPERTLMWMNEAAAIAKVSGVAVLMKIHVSTGQEFPKYGNFNFLARHASPDVGVLPHTVYLYDLEAPSAPMYGNRDFSGIREFLVSENPKRRTWYYPETSYFCALDIDVPLLLTDYLVTRAKDFSFLAKHGIEGQLNFTTGHESGYWLFDWTTALLNDRDVAFDPYVALKLLGEDPAEWKKIVDYQSKYVVGTSVIGSITGVEVGHELFYEWHKTLDKNLMRDLRANPAMLAREISALTEAVNALPLDVKIVNPELASLWRVTALRIDHALQVRVALASASVPEAKKERLDEAARIRAKAQTEIDALVRDFSRYPEARLYDRHENPTAYPYGYLYPVRSLHYWDREESIVRTNTYRWPFYKSLLTFSDVLFGPVL